MTDIVERLRAASYGSHGLKAEAADEIERLKAARHADSQRMVRMSDEYEAAQDEIERLRGTLRYIAVQARDGHHGVLRNIQSNAEGALDGSTAKMQRAALEMKP